MTAQTPGAGEGTMTPTLDGRGVRPVGRDVRWCKDCDRANCAERRRRHDDGTETIGCVDDVPLDGAEAAR